MKHLLFFVFLLNSWLGFSQAKKTPDVFEPAYVITLKGDTLKGSIKMPKTTHKAIWILLSEEHPEAIFLEAFARLTLTFILYKIKNI